MNNHLDESADEPDAVTGEAAALRARHLLSSLPRCDQRRWAEVFIQGLVTVPGRKTIKKISGHVAEGGAEQCLQQFVNQSTWRWDTVRRDLALRLAETHEPLAWVIMEVPMAKNGHHSVGVARQFAHTAGRVLNCQLGLAVFLVGRGWSCPVNWRLMLPRCWDEDKERRKKAHLPEDEHCLPRWRHMLDAIDEMTTEWGLPPLTIVADASHEQQLEPLLHDMEERSLSYTIQVAPGRPAATVRSPAGLPQTMSFSRVITESVTRRTAALNVWQLPVGRAGRTQLIATRLPAGSLPQPAGSQPQPAAVPGGPTRPRYVAAEWSSTRKSPRATWVTSSGPDQLPATLNDLALLDQAAADLSGLYDGLGLGHFEGRSFVGWHHYVTLVSVAHACRHLDPLGMDAYPAATNVGSSWVPAC